MASWEELCAAEPDLTSRGQQLFEAHKHKTMATLRKDGSPRISGIELAFTDGQVVLGSMPGAVKAQDLKRDPRLALHSASDDPVEGEESSWPGDAKLAGRAIAQPDTEDGAHMFHVDIAELVVTRVGEPADHLVIESWHEGRGYERRTRK